VKRAILTHRRDFIAIAVLVVAAILVTGYILDHQPSFTFGQSYYTIYAQFSEASAVTSGQGQPVTIAGVQVGKVGSIKLRDGKAVVQMNIDKKYEHRVFRDATVLLRPRTPLKDMYLSLNPGSSGSGSLPAGSTLGTGQTNPDVDVSEILSSLDADSRNYLLLLLSGGAQIFRDHGDTEQPSPEAVGDLRGTLKRFAPLNRDTENFASLLATRQGNLRGAIHNLNLVAGSLGSVDTELSSLIKSSDTNFTAISDNDAQLEDTLQLFPATLRQADTTLAKVKTFANATGTTLTALQPFARNLAPALRAARPLFKDTTPVIANQLRPVSVSLQPVAKTLAPAARALNQATPALSGSVAQLNTVFNELAHDPGKSKGQSYLFYGAWLAHITDSLVSNQDANGAALQGQLMGNCISIYTYQDLVEPNAPSLGVILNLANLPKLESLPGVTVKPPPAPGVPPIVDCSHAGQ
jgi:phospholipid/cholesterol/gamma-HCH transport system substrate-binding protein